MHYERVRQNQYGFWRMLCRQGFLIEWAKCHKRVKSRPILALFINFTGYACVKENENERIYDLERDIQIILNYFVWFFCSFVIQWVALRQIDLPCIDKSARFGRKLDN